MPPEAESENRKDWRYSADGELIMETGPHGAELYDYDRAGWLRSHSPAQGVQERFHWDKAGNPVNEYETVADNRVRAWGKYRYDYDEWGQVILRGEGHREKRLEWDADGHLLRVKSGDRTTHYRYDALGRRTHKVTFTDMQERVENETHFLWQGTRLLEERTGESRKTYIYGDARSPVPVACAERRAGREEIYHYQSDPSLRIRTVTDETGKVVWDGCWQAWGRMQAELSGPGGFEQNLRLAGQYYDRESGLHYNLFRYYDPDVPGRFLSSDPIGLAGGINLYRYAPNALGWIDPWGWTPWNSGMNGATATVTVDGVSHTAMSSSTGHAEINALNWFVNEGGGITDKNVTIKDVTGLFSDGNKPVGVCTNCRANAMDILIRNNAGSLTMPKTVGNVFQYDITIPSSEFSALRDKLLAIKNSGGDYNSRSNAAWAAIEEHGSIGGGGGGC
ncbi:TPA: hypothetical protein O7X39_004504 [Salmonella enterica]|nr:hypothetical protein [Salmonella enterica]